jgi:hypothetical protein
LDPTSALEEVESFFECIPREWSGSFLLPEQKHHATAINPLDDEGSTLRGRPKTLTIMDFCSNGSFG